MSLFFNQDTAPSQLLPEQGPPGPAGPTGPQGPQGPAGAAGASTWDELTGKPTSFTPSTHKASHATGGTDVLTPADIGAQSIFVRTTQTFSTDQTITAARSADRTISNTNASGITLTLPILSEGTLSGDIQVIRGGSTMAGSITIRAVANISPLVYNTLATINATGQSYRFLSQGGNSGSWARIPVDTHTHAIADITDLQSALDFSTAITSAAAPATSGSVGSAGSIRYDGDYIYICTATNTWRRTAVTSW